jgi:hypothetical protein
MFDYPGSGTPNRCEFSGDVYRPAPLCEAHLIARRRGWFFASSSERAYVPPTDNDGDEQGNQTEDDSLNCETQAAATIRQFCNAVNGNEYIYEFPGSW